MPKKSESNDNKFDKYVIGATFISFILGLVIIAFSINENKIFITVISIILVLLAAFILYAYFSKEFDSISKDILAFALAILVLLLYCINDVLINVLGSILGVTSFLYLFVERIVEGRKRN